MKILKVIFYGTAIIVLALAGLVGWGLTPDTPTFDNDDQYYDIGFCGMPESVDMALIENGTYRFNPYKWLVKESGDLALSFWDSEGQMMNYHKEATKWYYHQGVPEHVEQADYIKTICEQMRDVASWAEWRHAKGLPPTVDTETYIRDMNEIYPDGLAYDEYSVSMETEATIALSLTWYKHINEAVERLAKRYPEFKRRRLPTWYTL